MKIQKNKILPYIHPAKSGAGFTLIELLIVLAIIGILATIIIASLNTAKSKGADANVKQNLQGIKSEAEVVYDNTGSYDTVCSNTNISDALTSASNASGAPSVCNNSSSEWAVSATLKGAGGFWCVDFTGTSTPEAVSLVAETACP